MLLKQRIEILVKLGGYMISKDAGWLEAKETAAIKNPWFLPAFIQVAIENIAGNMLQPDKLEKFAAAYPIPDFNNNPKETGIVMAGNIPLVGFHDFLCCFLSGHPQRIKLSAKDDVLLKHLVTKMCSWNDEVDKQVQFSEMLKNCTAYIATGSGNSARYFEQYFGKYPHIIRKNKTAVALLTGNESSSDLEALADDVHLFFGLGCRNVTKIYVPENYDFVPLLTAFRKYSYFADHHKYKNNYDYQLAIHLLNHVFYMTNESILLIENESVFSPIGQLNYSFYSNAMELKRELEQNNDLQCIVGEGFIPFGTAQQPVLDQFADGVDTMSFLVNL
jgi:hypothetical protein